MVKAGVPVLDCVEGPAEVDKAEFSFDPTRPVYTDGSCLHPSVAPLAAAAGAAVQINDRGHVTHAAYVCLHGGHPHSAAAAEHHAAALSQTVGTLPPLVYTDCASVIASAASPVWA